MTHLLFLLLAGQTESPPPPTTPPPVLHMEGTTSAPTPKPAVPAHAADVPVASGSRGAPVFLTINSNRQDVLLLRFDDASTACTVPCNKLVPGGPKDQYFLGGPGLTNSNNFDLADGIKGARINVRAGTKLGKIMGIVLTAVGAPFVLGGGLGFLSWGILQDPKVQAQIAQSGTQTVINPTTSLIIAIVELAAGAAALTTGLILWPTNTTPMTITTIEPPAPDPVVAPELPPAAVPEVTPAAPPAPAEH